MDLKIDGQNLALGQTGLPRRVAGFDELLQNAALRLNLRRGMFPYGRGLGSGLWQWDPAEEHAGERALTLCNEALLDMPGVRAESVTEIDGDVAVRLSTPLGEGEVAVWRPTTES